MAENETLERWTDQRTPALAIVARGDQIKKVRSSIYLINSQSREADRYLIQLSGDKWTCECRFYQHAKTECVHILAARFSGNIAAAIESTKERPACPECKAANVGSKGKRNNKHGSVQRWVCHACGHKFTGKDGFQNRRAEPRIIALGLDLYFRGLSLRKVADHIKQVHNLTLSPMTIYRWVTHYSGVVAKWMDKQAALTGKKWHIDETVVNVNGQNTYLWNVMDGDTRFLLATHISKTRSMENTRAPLRKARLATPTLPDEVRSDGMMAYPYAVQREIGLGKHRRVPSIKAKDSNNRIERFHGTQKERIKVMRAFDNDAGAAGIAEGFRVHYNLVRKHSAIGTTPGEAAGFEPIQGFKWLELVQQAAADANQ